MRYLEIRKTSDFDEPINRVLSELKNKDVASEDYDARLAYLERLNRLRNDQNPNRVSPDTMAVVVANFLGILVIVGYEHGHVIVTKSLGFLLRTKHQ